MSIVESLEDAAPRSASAAVPEKEGEPAPDGQERQASLARFDETLTDRLNRPFAVTGRRSFLIGHMDGSFPDMGHHLPGEMGGLWAYPIKLADGFWFGVSLSAEGTSPGEDRISWMHGPNCRSFTMGMGMVQREFVVRAGDAAVNAWQRIWVPETETGVVVEVELENPGPEPLELTLSWVARFDIQGAWWSDWPNRPDEAAFEARAGGLLAWDSLRTEWAACMLGELLPARHQLGPDLWACERTGSLEGSVGRLHGGILRNPGELQGRGVSGRLEYDLALAPGERAEMHFAIAGGTDGAAAALECATGLLSRRATLLPEKLALQAEIAADFPTVASPRPDLDRVFEVQNPCLDMLTLDIPDVGRGLVAGLHGFGWFFGCDTYYSVSGLLVSGQAATALENLRLLGRYAARQAGRTPHEITPTGELFNPGNTVETAEFVTSVERAWRWTGDRRFLDEMYELCSEGLFGYLLGACDPHGDLLPDGAGLLELKSARHGKKLDVACALYQALRSMEYLACSVGDEGMHTRCLSLSEEVRARIEKHFWVPERQEYVWRIGPDLSVHPQEPAHSYVALEMGLVGEGDEERIALLFDRVESPAHTSPRGIIHPGTIDFVMPIQNAIVALAEFRYGRPDKGLWYLERMAELAGHYMPWAIPEFTGPRGCFLQAWSSAGYNWLLVQGLLRLNPDPADGVVWVQPQLPSGWQYFEVRNLSILGRRCNLLLERDAAGGPIVFTGTTETAGAAGLAFQVDQSPRLPVSFV